ncbi:hypothetical protein BY996DRAFT_6438552 [Phakopsora pachyrhizi]|nr:hypothetical protein BY996DRAFT_6438552 [Phakopsora pachyrhizi]
MNYKSPSKLEPSIPSASSPTAISLSSSSSIASIVNQSNGSKAGSHLVEYFLVSGAAGAVSQIMVSPLERLKIILTHRSPTHVEL